MGLTRTQKMTRGAMLAAITIVLAVTPLGYIPINPAVTVTLMVVPIALGGLILGWPYGTLLGLIFGITSFIRAPGEFLGQVLLSQSMVMTFVACVVPRALVGLLGDYLGFLVSRRGGLRKLWFYSLSGALCSLCNTVLFLLFVSLGFNAATALADSTQMGMALDIGFIALLSMVAMNGLLEVLVGAILVGLLARVLMPARPGLSAAPPAPKAEDEGPITGG